MWDPDTQTIGIDGDESAGMGIGGSAGIGLVYDPLGIMGFIGGEASGGMQQGVSVGVEHGVWEIGKMAGPYFGFEIGAAELVGLELGFVFVTSGFDLVGLTVTPQVGIGFVEGAMFELRLMGGSTAIIRS